MPDPETPPVVPPVRASVPEVPPRTRSSGEIVHDALSGQIEHYKAQLAAAEAARKAAETERDTHKTAAETAKAEADARITEFRRDAAMSDAARAAGLIDPDALKLADLSGVKLDKDGKLVGAAEAIAALKLAKPYLFADAAHGTKTGTTSGTGTAPPPNTGGKNARTMTDAEVKAELAALGVRL